MVIFFINNMYNIIHYNIAYITPMGYKLNDVGRRQYYSNI